MQRRSRTERPRLPHAPLLFAHPLRVPGGMVAGAAVLDEVEADRAVWAFMALRAAHAWAEGPATARTLLPPGGVDRWEEEIVERAVAEDRAVSGDRPPLLSALAALVATVRRPDEVEAEDVAWACLCVMEWALGHGAVATALAFSQAAALARPERAGLAWVAGRTLRNHGRTREAEWWLRRAVRVAVWTRDWEVMALGLNSRANLAYRLGDVAQARRDYLKALRISRRHRLGEVHASLLHDLFVFSFATGDSRKAERYAEQAFRRYGRTHPHLPELAYDIAYSSMHRADFARALPVLRDLLQHFRGQPKRFQLLAATARAAAACGDREMFESLWSEAFPVAPDLREKLELAPALVDLGLGAASLASWDRAAEVLEHAARIADELAANDVSARAQTALDHVRAQTAPDLASRATPYRRTAPGDGVLAELLSALHAGRLLDRSGGA